MEELMEKRIWQRVRGEGVTERVRAILADQGPLLGTYRIQSRRVDPVVGGAVAVEKYHLAVQFFHYIGAKILVGQENNFFIRRN